MKNRGARKGSETMTRLFALARRLKRWVASGHGSEGAFHDAQHEVRTGKRPDQVSTVARDLVALALCPSPARCSARRALGLVDTKLVGGLGAAALGGVGIATMLAMYLNYALPSSGLMRAVKVRTRTATGRGTPGGRHSLRAGRRR